MNGERICIASKSNELISYVCKRLEEIGAQNKIYRALDEEGLNQCLTVNCPRVLIIEASFWYNATPQEIVSIINRFNGLRIYAFGAGDYTDNFKKRIIRVGTDGFLNIRKGRASFRNELKLALSGKLVIPPELDDGDLDVIPETNDFTNRDLQVIHLLIEEMDNRTIAETLGVKEQAIRNRRSGIYAKINVDNMVGLIKYIFRHGVVSYNEFMAS